MGRVMHLLKPDFIQSEEHLYESRLQQSEVEGAENRKWIWTIRILCLSV